MLLNTSQQKLWDRMILFTEQMAVESEGEFSPAVLMVAPEGHGKESTAFTVINAEGSVVSRALKEMLEKTNPEYYIIVVAGYATSDVGYLRVMRENLGKIANLPESDRWDMVGQYLVSKKGEVVRARTYKVVKGGEVVRLEEMAAGVKKVESRFAVRWGDE